MKAPKLGGFTANLRFRVLTALGYKPCPKCGSVPKSASIRAAAKRIGVNQSSLWRFLHGGKSPSSEMIDVLVEWLATKPAGRE